MPLCVSITRLLLLLLLLLQQAQPAVCAPDVWDAWPTWWLDNDRGSGNVSVGGVELPSTAMQLMQQAGLEGNSLYR